MGSCEDLSSINVNKEKGGMLYLLFFVFSIFIYSKGEIEASSSNYVRNIHDLISITLLSTTLLFI